MSESEENKQDFIQQARDVITMLSAPDFAAKLVTDSYNEENAKKDIREAIEQIELDILSICEFGAVCADPISPKEVRELLKMLRTN